MHELSQFMTIIIDSIYTPLVNAFNLLPLMAQSIDNGYFAFTLSTLLATIIVCLIFFALLYLPMYLIKKFKALI